MSKAGRPKKGSTGLPEWFDIEKYRQAKTYRAAEWYQQLAFQFSVRGWQAEDLQRYLSNEWLGLLQADPHITIARLEEAFPVIITHEYEGEDIYIRGTPGDELISEIALDVEPAYGVRAATNGDLYKASLSFPKILRKPLSPKVREGKDSESQALQEAWYEQYHAPFTNKRFSINEDKRFACIDFSLPEAILKRKFADYLKSQKKTAEEARTPFLKTSDFDVWYNCGVLPYLDLCLWEAATGRSFQGSAFANALNL